MGAARPSASKPEVTGAAGATGAAATGAAAAGAATGAVCASVAASALATAAAASAGAVLVGLEFMVLFFPRGHSDGRAHATIAKKAGRPQAETDHFATRDVCARIGRPKHRHQPNRNP
jgi:hypothetical protein